MESGASKKKVEGCYRPASRRVLREVGNSANPGAFDNDLPSDRSGVGFAVLFSGVGLRQCEVHGTTRAEKLSP